MMLLGVRNVLDSEECNLIQWYFLLSFQFWQKLLQRGQERDQFLADLRKAEGPDVVECRQTIQIMQEKLDEREGESPKSGFMCVLARAGLADAERRFCPRPQLNCPGETAKTTWRTLLSPRKRMSS